MFDEELGREMIIFLTLIVFVGFSLLMYGKVLSQFDINIT